MAYTVFLNIHNILRLAVILASIFVIFKTFTGWQGKKEWTKSDNLAKIIFVSLMDLQLVIGLILYAFLSPITTSAFSNMAAAMKNKETRFFTVEHTTIMIVALALAHIGSAKSKRADSDEAKHKTAFIFFTISLIVVLAGIPWTRKLLPF